MLYYRKRHSGILIQKSGMNAGYLAANTSETADYQIDSNSTYKSHKSHQSRHTEPGQPLWIDRRWNGTDYEKDSNSRYANFGLFNY